MNPVTNQTTSAPNPKPKRWKMMLLSFAFVYPSINIIFFLFGKYIFLLPQLLRTFVLAAVFVPLFGICIPLIQNRFKDWTMK
jgi:antibiotic biosynthesis monooxygenase (ABM) superfamily enzyme